ncbi:HAD family hydrolase [Candidatus Bathyarchaeota archaeon]|nr:HAD family hydrolase [Candidatus Bathyarchaeota archaeon]
MKPKRLNERKNTLTKPNTETSNMDITKLKVKAILFDLDGTIVDSRDAYVEAAKTAFQTMGLESPTMQTSLQIPKRLEQSLPIDDLTHTNTTRFLDIYLKTFYAITEVKTKPIPNIHAALENLQQKAKLALITMRNVPKITVAKELQQFGLAQYFTYILTAQDIDKPKPSPEALIKALKSIDVQICDCLIVGDSVIDINAGKAAGAKTIAVLSGLYTKQELAKLNPDLILKNVTQLPSHIG